MNGDVLSPALVMIVLQAWLGALLVFSASTKIRSPRDFVATVAAYEVVPPVLVPFVARGVVAAEIGFGLLLMTGALPVAASVGATVLLGVFMIAVAVNLIRKRNIGCGCPGSDGPISYRTLIRQGGLLAIAIAGLVAALAGSASEAGSGVSASVLSSLSGLLALSLTAWVRTLLDVRPVLGVMRR